MPFYESVLIARQDISAGQVDTLADDMEKIITDNGGNVARREYWGLRSLAYRMKKPQGSLRHVQSGCAV